MSVLNRVVVVIISLAILAGAVITLLVATGGGEPDIMPSGWLESQLQWAFQEASPLTDKLHRKGYRYH